MDRIAGKSKEKTIQKDSFAIKLYLYTFNNPRNAERTKI